MEDVSPSPLLKQEDRGTDNLLFTTTGPDRAVFLPSTVCQPSPAAVPAACHPAKDDLWQLPGRLRINPSLWDKEDVSHWLHWAQREYALRRPEKGHFEMNGRALCLLTKEDFRRRCPSSGDVLYEILQCVKQQRRSVVWTTLKHTPLSHTQQTPHSHAQQTPLGQSAISHRLHEPQPTGPHVATAVPVLSQCTAWSPPPLPPCEGEEPLNLSNRKRVRGGTPPPEANGRIPECRLLWDYVYQLLSDQRYQAFIRWEDHDSLVFKVVDPNGLAQLWGNHKNRANMTYEKMSRALRHYYKLNIIKKEPGQKLLFRFLKTPQEIRRHRVDCLDVTESPEHTPPLNGASPEHMPESRLSHDYIMEGLEVSPEPSSPQSDTEA